LLNLTAEFQRYEDKVLIFGECEPNEIITIYYGETGTEKKQLILGSDAGTWQTPNLLQLKNGWIVNVYQNGSNPIILIFKD